MADAARDGLDESGLWGHHPLNVGDMKEEEPDDFLQCGDHPNEGDRLGAGRDGAAGFRPHAGSGRFVFLFLHVKGFFPTLKICT